MRLFELTVLTTLAALHDLNLAAFYCDRLYGLCAGQLLLPEHLCGDNYNYTAVTINCR